MIQLRFLSSLIDLTEETGSREVPFEGRTLAELAPDGYSAAVVNDLDTILRGSPEWDSCIPEDGSIVVFVRTHHGVELAIIGFAVANVLVAAGAFGGAALTAAALISGIAIIGAGLSLVRKLLTPSVAPLPHLGGGGGGEESPTFGFDAIQAFPANGAVVPVVYGEHRQGGGLVCAFRRANADDGQDLFALIALSHGEIESIGQYDSDQDGLAEGSAPQGLELNGIAASELRGLSVSLRMGADEQEVCPGFEELVTEYPQNFRLLTKPETSVFVWETKGPVMFIEADFALLQGLYEVNSKAKLKSEQVDVRMDIYEEDGVTLVDSTEYILKRKSRTPVYWTIRSPQLELARYVVKIYRSTTAGHEKDSVTHPRIDFLDVVAIDEIQSTVLTYPGIALLALKVKATEQLSGGFPRVSCMMKGRKVFTGSGTEWSDNPAWICRDMLSSNRFGLGNLLKDAVMDGDAFNTWAAFCDEEVPLYTGSVDTEKRHTFNGVIDTAKAGWEAALAIAATARAVIVKSGNTLRPKIEEAKSPSQMFGDGNSKNRVIAYITPQDRPNKIEVRFLDAANGYERTSATAEAPGLDEDAGSVRLQTVDAPGVTSIHQARRMAAYLLRSELKVGKFLTFETGIEAVVCEPGDVIALPSTNPGWAVSGRLAGADEESMTLDREFAFEAGVLYSILERDDATGGFMARDFLHSGGSSAVVPLAPSYGGTSAQGRVYILGRKLTYRSLWLVTRIVSTGDRALKRRIEALEYVPSVYTDDAEPLDPDLFIPEPGDAPVAVENIEAVESSETAGVSILDVSWDAAAGASRYAVWTGLNGSGLSNAGETSGTSLAVTTEALLGQVVQIKVQTIMPDGQRNSVANAPGILYEIAREDYGTALIEFPDNIGEAELNAVSGTAYTLSWTEPAEAPDSYEVRLGNFNDGPLIYAGASLSAPVVLSRAQHDFCIRGVNADGYVSPANFRITPPAVAHPSYGTVSLNADIDLSSTGTRSNLSIMSWFRHGGSALRQTDEALEAFFLSDVYDLGSSAATHVSLDVRTLGFSLLDADDREPFGTMKHRNWSGLTSEPVISATVVLEYSVAGTSWINWNVSALLGKTDIIATGRYFRVRVVMSSLEIDTGDDSSERIAAAMLERLHLILARA